MIKMKRGSQKIAERFQLETLKGQQRNQPSAEQRRAKKLFQAAVKQQRKGLLAKCKQKLLQAACIQRKCGYQLDLLETLECLARAFEASGDQSTALTAYFERIAIRDRLNTISRADQLKAELGNPLIVYGCVGLAEAAEVFAGFSTSLGKHQVYEVLLEVVYARESEENQIAYPEYADEIVRLAFTALKRNQLSSEEVNSECRFQSLKSSLLVSLPNSQGKKLYQFVHPSVMDWIVAREIAKEIKRGVLPTTSKINLYSIVSRAGVRSFIAELAQEDGLAFHDHLLKLVYQSRTDASVATASANAMTLLHQTGYCFAWRDFSGVNIAGANISGANLTGTNLENSQLQGVTLSGCTLFLTNLKRASLARADFGVCLSNQTTANVCLSSDGTVLASVREDNRVVLRDLATNQLLKTLEGNCEDVSTLWFSPDNVLIASVCRRNTILIWETATGRLCHRLHSQSTSITAGSFASDNSYVATGSENCTVVVWKIQSAQQVLTLHGHSSAVKAVCYSADGTLVASGSCDRSVIIWAVATGRRVHILNGHTWAVTAVCFSPHAKLIVSGRSDGSVILWDVVTGDKVWHFAGHAFGIETICFSHEGGMLASGSSAREVIMWETATGRQNHVLRSCSHRNTSIAFSADDELVVASCKDNAVTTLKPVYAHQTHADKVSAIAATPDGTLVASGSSDRKVVVWEPKTGQVISILQGHSKGVTAVCFSGDNSLLASGSWDGIVIVWSIANSQQVCVQHVHSCGVTAINFSPRGQLLVSASCDGKIVVWKTPDGEQMRVLTDHSSRITQVSFAGEDALVGCGHESNLSYMLWSTNSGYRTSVLDSHFSNVVTTRCSPDGKTLASGSRDRRVILWSTATGRLIHRLEGHSSCVTAICFSTDSSLLISGSRDGQLIVWAVATGQQIQIYQWCTEQIEAICFVPEKMLVAFSAGDAGTIALTQIPPDAQSYEH